MHAVLAAAHGDPFAFLGMHRIEPEGVLVVRCFIANAEAVAVVDTAQGPAFPLQRLHDSGFFAGILEGRTKPFDYRLRVTQPDGTVREIEDPYRFSLILSGDVLKSLAEGNDPGAYRSLGAHPTTIAGVAGTTFAVWAPHASRVAVIGSFNDWDGRRHGMRCRREAGVWEIFLPGVTVGDHYKYEIKGRHGEKLPDKRDPYTFEIEGVTGSASIVCDTGRYAWNDKVWMKHRASIAPRQAPMSIYEVHIASWRRKVEDGFRCLTFAELADDLVSYVAYMGFTHIGLLPVAEYRDESSLGYLPTAPFAPTRRFGTPDELKLLIDRCHQAGIGVIIDWTPQRFVDDADGLQAFDGAPLYEYTDPQRRHVPALQGLAYDLGRPQVVNYLISNALFWLEVYHVDGLRISGLPELLYRDFYRGPGQWTANEFGGNHNLEAIAFLRKLNEVVYGRVAGAFTVAEDNSGWQQLSHPTYSGGLGFGFAWWRPWVQSTLRHFARNPVHRKYYFDEVAGQPRLAFAENYILPLSHEEVSYGCGALISRMPGPAWERFANLRLLYGLLYTHPGKKLMFMGDEFAQEREWNSDISLDWHLAPQPMHQGIQRLVRDLNHVYRTTPALYEQECDPEGFEYVDATDADQGVLAFLRHGRSGGGPALVVCHFTPVLRQNYQIGVPRGGRYEERLNTDAEAYGGSNAGNAGGVTATEEPCHGHPFSVRVKLPPFATVILQHTGD